MDKYWDGNEWEEWCLLLIQRRYGADQVQTVPAKHRGDLGIEAFTHDGCAFQCYAAEEPISVKERFEKQRDKLTRDLKKLEVKKDEFKKLLGRVKIERYMFLVPTFDSQELVQHASTKAEEYRAKALPHLHDNFRIVVATDKAYAEYIDELLRRPRTLIDAYNSSQDDIRTWMTANADAVQKADTKLTALLTDQGARNKTIEGLITQYINGTNALDRMREKYPENWESTTRYQNTKESLLALEYPTFDGKMQTLTGMAKDIAKELETEVPALDNRLRVTLSWQSIADWILRCPLDFPHGGWT
ncbi:hypothetical protein AB0H12_09055 [Actinosynnema sp. NPDC023794]